MDLAEKGVGARFMLTIDAPSLDHARTVACDSLSVMTGHGRGSAGLGQVRKVPLMAVRNAPPQEVRNAQLRIVTPARAITKKLQVSYL
jgi:hypothetical protein